MFASQFPYMEIVWDTVCASKICRIEIIVSLIGKTVCKSSLKNAHALWCRRWRSGKYIKWSAYWDLNNIALFFESVFDFTACWNTYLEGSPYCDDVIIGYARCSENNSLHEVTILWQKQTCLFLSNLLP